MWIYVGIAVGVFIVAVIGYILLRRKKDNLVEIEGVPPKEEIKK